MAVRVVRLGTPRDPGEGLRLGTVRRPPRGVPKSEFATQDWYDVWFPTLAPTPDLMKRGLAAVTDAERQRFFRDFRKQMREPPAAHALQLLAALSQQANFSVGCYCENDARCHRSVLRQLLKQAGAVLVS